MLIFRHEWKSIIHLENRAGKSWSLGVQPKQPEMFLFKADRILLSETKPKLNSPHGAIKRRLSAKTMTE